MIYNNVQRKENLLTELWLEKTQIASVACSDALGLSLLEVPACPPGRAWPLSVLSRSGLAIMHLLRLVFPALEIVGLQDLVPIRDTVLDGSSFIIDEMPTDKRLVRYWLFESRHGCEDV